MQRIKPRKFRVQYNRRESECELEEHGPSGLIFRKICDTRDRISRIFRVESNRWESERELETHEDQWINFSYDL